MEFPANWPENCPPDAAVEARGGVFRLVKNDPPSDSDFLSHFETGRLPNAPACLRCGLSMFRELQDAIHQRSLFPKLGKLIATAVLQPEHGVTKPTAGHQPTHTTWWACLGVDRAALFSVVQEG